MQTIYKNFTRDLNRPEAIILCCSTGTGGLSDQVMKGTAIEAFFFFKKIFLERWGFWLRADCQGTSVPSYLCKKPTGTPVSFSSRSSNNPLWACLISDGDLHQITENWGHGGWSLLFALLLKQRIWDKHCILFNWTGSNQVFRRRRKNVIRTNRSIIQAGFSP